jgi:2-polyprenyl-3-methyl-5-hydroxy-6-metoxy-1,4-benzoquinol methylase
MRPPTTPAASRTIQLYDTAPLGDRFHVRARWWTAPLPAVERHLPVSGRVLEVGCGHGLFALYVALCAPARDVVGVDIDAHKIALAQDAAASLDPGEARVDFAVVEPGALPEGPFDAIVINDVLYLMSDAERRAVIDACVDRLAPDGVFVVKELDVTPRWKYQVGYLQELVATRVLRYTQGEQVEIAPMRQFVEQLRGRGLTVVESRVDRGYLHPHALLTARSTATD